MSKKIYGYCIQNGIPTPDNPVKIETLELEKVRINNMTDLIGKRVMTFDGHVGIVIKHFKPTGRDMTVHIKQDNGKVWYCPDYNIIEVVEDK